MLSTLRRLARAFDLAGIYEPSAGAPPGTCETWEETYYFSRSTSRLLLNRPASSKILGVNPSSTSTAGKAVGAFFFLFGLPFAGFGLWAYSQAFRLIGAPPGSQSFWYPFMFGTIFSGIGFGFMFLGVAGNRKYSRQLQVQAEHPAEPWLWRDDWAAGRVKSNTKGSMVTAWVFAIFWNLISWPPTIFALPNALREKVASAFVLLLFPAAGIVLLIYAIRKTLAFAEFGKTCFEMASVPAVIGRDLKGSIQARFPHSPDHGVQLRLSCVHRYVSGSGNNSTTNERILWRDEAAVNPGQLYAGPAGTTIPVSFHIPLDAPPTDNRTSRDQFVWQLEAIANVPGVDYHDVFEIPVFRTSQTPTVEEENQAEATASGFRAPEVSRPEHPTVRVQPVAGGTEFYCPPARNKGLAAFITLFAAIFGAIGYFLMHSRAPIIFPIAFGGFGLLIGYFALQMWLATARVIIGSSLRLQSGLLGGGKVREIAVSDIASITDRIGAQSGNGSGTPYYDIELNLTDGKKLTLGRSLRDKHEVEWLISEMSRLAGIGEKKMTAGAGR
jgi:hypothetical protein